VLATLGVPGGAGASIAANGSMEFSLTTFSAAGGEPNVSISPDGRTVLVDGLGSSTEPSNLWRSTDGGRTFTRLHMHVPNVGGNDFDMRWIDDHTVVAVDLSIGQGIFVDRSTDGGLHWTQTEIFEDQYDRPWLAVFHNHVYVVTKGFDGVPYCYVSTDGGRSFSPVPIPIYGSGVVPAEAGGQQPTPVDAFVTNNNAYVDHVASDPRTGQLYVVFGIDSVQTYSQQNPIGVPDRLYVARLVNGPAGQQFDVHPVYLGGSGDWFIDGFNWLTIDRAGTLYVLGNGLHDGHQSAWLAYSKDHGVHWSRLVDLAKGPGADVYGAIAAGAPGTLGFVYLHGTKANPNVVQDWYAETARVSRADTAYPLVQRSRPIAKPIHTKDICMSGIACAAPGFKGNRNLLDYVWDAVSPSGQLFAVVASDGPATGSHGKRVDVVLIRQVGGPSMGRGVPS
jgi:hypothetical protein